MKVTTLALGLSTCVLICVPVGSWAQDTAGPARLAQAPQASATVPVVGFMHAIHATKDVEETLAFYRETFGLTGEVRRFANDAVPVLTDSPGVSLRIAMLTLPGQGFNFELTEFSNVQRSPAQPQIVDPGAPHMKFLVRDIEPVVAAVRTLDAPILTRTGAPVRVTMSLGTVEAIFFRDPDGYIVEAIEVPTAAQAQASAGNVVGSIMGLTVRDIDASMRFWHDLLGFELTGEAQFSTDAAMLDLMGVADGGSFRTVAGVVPGSSARIELIEFKGVPRRPFDLRVTDPGASGMAIRVTGISELLERMKAEGVRVISRDGKLVEWSATLRNVFVKDPNGLNIELVGNVE